MLILAMLSHNCFAAPHVAQLLRLLVTWITHTSQTSQTFLADWRTQT